MGIIIRQSVKSSVVNIFGVALAGLSSLFIYPLYTEVYGLYSFLFNMATLLIPLASLGLIGSIVKFFPRFKTKDNKNNGFLRLAIVAFVIMYASFLTIFLLFKENISLWARNIGLDKNGIMLEYFPVILTLCGLLILLYSFIMYASNYKRIVVPQIISQLGMKLFLPITILACAAYSLSLHTFSYLIVGFYIFTIIALLFYLNHLNVLKFAKIDLSFLKKSEKKEMINYKLFSSLNHFGSMVAFRIDGIMIPMMLSLSSNGIYALMLFMSSVIEIPAIAIKNISTPIISACWQEKDFEQIKTIYKKAALNSTIPAIAIICFLWFSFNSISAISANESKFLLGKFAFLFLAVAKLIDSITSINDQIIVYSPKYKYNLIFILVLGIINITLNYYLINEHGIMGAAAATCFAYLVYNTTKLIFVYSNFNIHPFSKNLFLTILLGAFLTLVLWLLHTYLPINNIFIALSVNVFIIALIYFVPIFQLKVSDDINNTLLFILNKIKNVANRKLD